MSIKQNFPLPGNAESIQRIPVDPAVPGHAGEILIFDGAKYVPGDPQVQGLYAAGSTICPAPAYAAPTCIQPVLVGAEDPSGLLQNLNEDAFGNLKVAVENLNTTVFGSPAAPALDVYVVNPISVAFPLSIGVTQGTSPWVVQDTAVEVSLAAIQSDLSGVTYTLAGSPAASSLNVYITNPTVAVSNFPVSQVVTLASTTITSGTVTANQGNPNSTTNAWPVELSSASGNFRVGTKAASTAAVAADPSLVVQLSPNQPALTTPLNVSTKTALTASSPTAASVGVASASAVGAQATRKGLVLTNTSANIISLGIGVAAVLYSGITLGPYGTWEMDEYTFSTAAINAIASVAASNLAIQEFLT